MTEPLTEAEELEQEIRLIDGWAFERALPFAVDDTAPRPEQLVSWATGASARLLYVAERLAVVAPASYEALRMPISESVLDLDLIESPTDIVSLRIARAARDSSREERG